MLKLQCKRMIQISNFVIRLFWKSDFCDAENTESVNPAIKKNLFAVYILFKESCTMNQIVIWAIVSVNINAQKHCCLDMKSEYLCLQYLSSCTSHDLHLQSSHFHTIYENTFVLNQQQHWFHRALQSCNLCFSVAGDQRASDEDDLHSGGEVHCEEIQLL